MPTTTKTQDAVALLKKDHQKVKELFDAFEKSEDADKKLEIAQEAFKELKVHSAIEEEIFYPAVREAIDEADILNEADEEHRVAKTIIKELESEEAVDEHFEAKFTVLAENVRHHIKEEEGEIFNEAKDSDIDLKALGEEMMTRKEELTSDEAALEQAEENSEVKPYQELA